MSETLLIDAANVERIVREVGLDPLMDELIDALTAELLTYDATAFESPARGGFSYRTPRDGLVEWMPAYEHEGWVTIKVVGYHPSNPRDLGLPTILSTVSAYDSTNGHLTGIADATFLTALRTGAASGVASRLLAKPDSSVVGLIGCGAQAVSQLHAMMRCFPVETVMLHDVDQSQMESFARRIVAFSPGSIDVRSVSIDDVFSKSDVLCTSTSIPVGAGPLFADQDCVPWLHVNAVGSDFPGKFELPVELLQRSLVCPDFLPQALRDGECQQLSLEEVGPSLAELVANPALGDVSRMKTTVFDSTGWALTDHLAMKLLMGHAERLGACAPIDLETTSGDPYAPYEWSADREFATPLSDTPTQLEGLA